MTTTSNIPSPSTQDDPSENARALEEAKFLQDRPDAPELVQARQKHALDIIQIRRAFMRGVRHVAYILPWMGLAMLAVWLWHVLASAHYRWLPIDEVRTLQTLLFSGAVSALATAIATKKI